MGKINRKRKRQANNQKNNSNEESIIQPAPYVIVVHGPPKVGKSLLIKSLVDHYSNQNPVNPGRIAIVAGSAGEEQRRIEFVECPNNVNGMIDAAKYADAVILLIDVSYEFEMETFEFVSLLKVHGMPKVIGVFTHLDCFPTEDANMKEIITARFKKKFRNEIDEQAQIFCLSAPDEDEKMYQISELASFISGMEFHPMPWRAAHPYVLVDHFEDVTTPTEGFQIGEDCFSDIILYGYLRGCEMNIKKKGTKVHIAGVGDFLLASVTNVDVTDLKIDITDNLDEETHLKKKILRVGSYLKFKVRNVPSKMVNNRDPRQPILVGGISHREENVGSISARLERHSFHTKSLRTNDPIIVSAGWRRYQTSFIYSPEDLSLDFTPEDKPCLAKFGGYFATTGTVVVAVQHLADNRAAFRILATGKVLGFNDHSAPAIHSFFGGFNNHSPHAIHYLSQTLMTAVEPGDRVWAADTKESEKCKAHVVWGSQERKVAAEGLRDKMSKLQEEMLKLPCQKRKTEEQRRAVIILERIYFGNRAEFLEAYQKKEEEDIRKNRSHGMVSRYYRRDGNTTVAN